VSGTLSTPRDPRLTPHSLDLGHGVELRASLPALDGSIEIAVLRRGRKLFDTVFRPDSPRRGFKLALPVLELDAELEIDAFLGELRASGHIRVRGLLRWRWHTVLDADDEVLMRICPAVGQIDGTPAVIEPVIEDPRFGRSQLCTPTVLRIFVDEDERAIADVGRIVKQRMFPKHRPFVFNTVACVGRVSPEGAPGLYSDPTSIWFNVFFGHYQLDCPKPAWTRPFGYRSAAGIESEFEPEDIARLGKSDWNWFSNWMYGVPLEDVLPYSGIDMSSIVVETAPPARIGSTLWHGLTLSQVEVASCYESDSRGAGRLVRNTIVDDVWRRSFGLPNPQPEHSVSFIPTTIEAQVRMAYWEDERAFHTLIFGGTAAADADPAFLAAQMAAVESVIERGYPNRGFGG
jgi:hypothetical protein